VGHDDRNLGIAPYGHHSRPQAVPPNRCRRAGSCAVELAGRPSGSTACARRVFRLAVGHVGSRWRVVPHSTNSTVPWWAMAMTGVAGKFSHPPELPSVGRRGQRLACNPGSNRVGAQGWRVRSARLTTAMGPRGGGGVVRVPYSRFRLETPLQLAVGGAGGAAWRGDERQRGAGSHTSGTTVGACWVRRCQGDQRGENRRPRGSAQPRDDVHGCCAS
jgi:hypothetical protein